MLAKLLYLWPLLVSGASGNVCEGEGCARKSARILGGERAEQNGRPFQVALYSRVGTTGELGFCGGSLISQEWVITAAHCLFHNGEEVNHVQTSAFFVIGTYHVKLAKSYCFGYKGVTGVYSIEVYRHPELIRLNNDEEEAILGAHSLYDRYENGRRVVNVDELVVHPDYDPDTFTNDIALVKLANVIQLTDMVDTIQLPYRNISSFNFAGAGGTVSGWGIAAEGVTFISPTLRQKLMTVVTDAMCNVYYLNQLPQNTMCAFQGVSGTCKGDNGGPLTIFYNATEEVILVGVASFVSADGCNDDQPSVFTRVQRYLDWISGITGVEII